MKSKIRTSPGSDVRHGHSPLAAAQGLPLAAVRSGRRALAQRYVEGGDWRAFAVNQ